VVATKNLLLNSLSTECLNSLLPHLQPVDLPIATVLYEPETTPVFAYFMLTGIASVVASASEGGSVEVGLIGREGVVGALHLLGTGLVPTRCFMQLAGSGLRIRLSELQKVFFESTEIRGRLLEFVQEQALTLSQVAGCHRLHGAEQRLARWLLMVQDRVENETLGLTQTFLAEMLGSQRTTVTVIAGVLQRNGLIEYSRGSLRIVDRKGLEHAACGCYLVTQGLLTKLYQ
jgi:CRP-like cAMP-binding protein